MVSAHAFWHTQKPCDRQTKQIGMMGKCFDCIEALPRDKPNEPVNCA